MFTQTAEYALRVVAYLAGHPGAARTTRQIARGTRVPEGYLSKILQTLSRAGLVSSQRGMHGGSILVPDPQDVSILHVINAVAPLPRIHVCPLGIGTHGSTLCALHKRLDKAMDMVEKAFAESTLADLLAEPSASTPLCEIPGGTPGGEPRPVKLRMPKKKPHRAR
jgi:Rrf2 family protein